MGAEVFKFGPLEGPSVLTYRPHFLNLSSQLKLQSFLAILSFTEIRFADFELQIDFHKFCITNRCAAFDLLSQIKITSKFAFFYLFSINL